MSQVQDLKDVRTKQAPVNSPWTAVWIGAIPFLIVFADLAIVIFNSR